MQPKEETAGAPQPKEDAEKKKGSAAPPPQTAPPPQPKDEAGTAAEKKPQKEVKGDKGKDDKTKAKEGKQAAGQPTLNLAGAVAQKLEPLKGEENVTGAHMTAVKILDKVRAGDNLRDSIQRYVPEGNKLRPWVKAIVEASLEPPTLLAQPTGLKMLRRIAIANQEAGRREFSSKDVALTLGPHGEELILWLRLEQNAEYGVALIKQLEPQTDHLPAQYQFKHLSFQEGLFAEHLLFVVDDPSWTGWDNDAVAAAFLNNAYMNNTCRIAAGRLGTLLAKRRARGTFRRRASASSVGARSGTCSRATRRSRASASPATRWRATTPRASSTCSSATCSSRSTCRTTTWTSSSARSSAVCKALFNNQKITELNLSSNRLGLRAARRCALPSSGAYSCASGLSNNQPQRDMALADLLRVHGSLTSMRRGRARPQEPRLARQGQHGQRAAAE